MDPIAPIVIHQPEILPVAPAAGTARASRDGGRRGGDRESGSKREPAEDPRHEGGDASDQLAPGPAMPHLLDVLVDDHDTETGADDGADDGAKESANDGVRGGHIDLTA